MARIVLNTFGSFGDIHPFLALGLELARRGHEPVIATSEVYRAKILAEGLEFAPVRPDVGELMNKPELLEKMWHPRLGPEFLVRRYLMPMVEESFLDLSAACAKADLLVTHMAGYAGPVVAEKMNLPWLSVVLQPILMLSAYDPPVLSAAPWVGAFHRFGPRVLQVIFALGRRSTRRWSEPVRRLRRKVGLRTPATNPIFEGQFSPWGTLALFSRHFAMPQPDWPPNVTVTGFPFFDRQGAGWVKAGTADAAMRRLMSFVDAGPPPLVFTLGSAAVMQSGNFYRESLEAALKLGLRAVLLVGLTPNEQLPQPLPASIHVAGYAPYSELLPRAAVTVHQGGIGTTAQALRAGRPMLVVPWSHDQPDNAERVCKLGVGRTLSRDSYRADTAAREISVLLKRQSYASRAAALGKAIAREDGVPVACNAIERVLKTATQ